jgi:hypothetical protein
MPVAGVQLADDAERRAPRAGRQRAGVAVGEHPQPGAVDAREQPVGSEPGQLSVRRLVVGGDPTRGDQHGIAAPVHQRTHLVDPPREVHRGGPGMTDAVDGSLHP